MVRVNQLFTAMSFVTYSNHVGPLPAGAGCNNDEKKNVCDKGLFCFVDNWDATLQCDPIPKGLSLPVNPTGELGHCVNDTECKGNIHCNSLGLCGKINNASHKQEGL